MTIDEMIAFCNEKSKNIKLKAEPQVFIDIAKILEELKAYKEAEGQKRLMILPDYAYFIKDNQIYKGWVQEITYSVCRKLLYDIRYDDNSLTSYRGYIGNTVFLTKEEAEQALADMKGV